MSLQRYYNVMTDINKKTISVTLPHWVIEDIIGETNNRSERVQELLLKGTRYEDLQALAGVNDLHRYVASASLDKEKEGSGPDGRASPLAGSRDEDGGFHKTAVVGSRVPA